MLAKIWVGQNSALNIHRKHTTRPSAPPAGHVRQFQKEQVRCSLVEAVEGVGVIGQHLQAVRTASLPHKLGDRHV